MNTQSKTSTLLNTLLISNTTNPEEYILYTLQGDVYKGPCVNNHPEGKGTIVFHNNCKWEGEWKDGKRNGSGSYYFCEDVWFEGVWENDHCISRSELKGTCGSFVNELELFDPVNCRFSFMNEREVVLCNNSLIS